MVENGALLDINLCRIKLHGSCDFDPKKIFFLQNNIYSIIFLQLILHFSSLSRIITQLLLPLASGVVNLGGRRALI